MQGEPELSLLGPQAHFSTPDAGHRRGDDPHGQHIVTGPASRAIEVRHIRVGSEFILCCAIHSKVDGPHVEQLVRVHSPMPY